MANDNEKLNTKVVMSAAVLSGLATWNVYKCELLEIQSKSKYYECSLNKFFPTDTDEKAENPPYINLKNINYSIATSGTASESLASLSLTRMI